jgi:hypothetical protein
MLIRGGCDEGFGVQRSKTRVTAFLGALRRIYAFSCDTVNPVISFWCG